MERGAWWATVHGVSGVEYDAMCARVHTHTHTHTQINK